MFKLKRVYDAPSLDDGSRVLVDRLWPRGLTKKKAAVDLWLKEIAPTTELRQWFGHDPAKWADFQRRYTKELKERSDLVTLLRQKGRNELVTLVYGARDETHNAAVALKAVLTKGRR